MTQVSTPRGLIYPMGYSFGIGSFGTIDAATEKYAMIGRLYLAGRSASAKTLSNVGNIQFRTATVTFANGSTTVDIGIQDVASGAGPIAQPDGTFDVKATLTGGGGGLTTTAWNTVVMTTGTKTMSHGDLIAVVWDMTARGGADSVTITPSALDTSQAGVMSPITNAFVSSAWQTSAVGGAARAPNVVIVFDDGTIGTLDFSIPVSTATAETWVDATNPDERGLIFQVPWDCKIDGLFMFGGITDAASDFTLKLYSDPTGTPGLLASAAVLAEQLGVVNTDNNLIINLATEVSLSKNTDYIVTVLATGTTNVRLKPITLGDTAHRVFFPGGTTLKKGTRDGSAGAFTAESPAITIYQMGVRISSFDDGSPPPTYGLGI